MKDLVRVTVEVSGSRNVSDELNKYLSQGWVIVESWAVGYGDNNERSEKIHFLLGWIDKDSTPVYPPSPPEEVF